MPNYSKLAAMMNDLEEERENRDYMSVPEGQDGPIEWVCLITAVINKETQDDKDLTIMELEVVSSTHPEHDKGHLVKHIWALGGVVKWRIEKNLRALKGILRKLLGIVGKVSDAQMKEALEGAEEAALAGHYIRVVANRLIAETTGTAYTKYDFFAVSREDLEKPKTPKMSKKTKKVVSADKEEEATKEVSVTTVALDADDDPAF